jgi:cytochrome c-type biogenesis protein
VSMLLAGVSFASVVATLAAGLFSFLSPCTAPLLPAYLAAISGVSSAELVGSTRGRSLRGRLVAGSVLYVLGFTTVFVLLGLGAGGIGFELRQLKRPLEIAGGLLMLAFGLALAGLFRVGWLEREFHLSIPDRLRQGGTRAAFLIGMLFALGWTPCVGPFLSTALGLAALSGHALEGGLLLAVYALGLGLPFILVAFAWASLPAMPRRITRIAPTLARVGGLVTAALGVLVATGWYTHLTSWLASISTPV